ncbi:4-alpha-glucanotransferase [Arthrobacter sp. NPDC089319]|uniref:4-alpha-glucanotransferase n=1 Tax=Arthrobacter sp. NPDC089319 TaxID=3155915 RepID=UPI00342EB955
MAELTALQRLAREHGVGTTFRGWDGAEQAVAPATLVAVLTALGVPCNTDDDVTVSLRAAELAPLQRNLPPAVVVRQGDATEVPVNVSAGASPRVQIVLEDGSRRDVDVVPGGPHEAAGVPRDRLAAVVPADLPLGWHTLELTEAGTGRAPTEESGAGNAAIDQAPIGQRPPGQPPATPDSQARCALVVTPQRLTTADRLHRTWGLMAQLYSVRSRSSWGIGDLDDLAVLAETAAAKGAGFVLINPLHAAQPKPPVEPSPYLPATRRFVNPIYLRVEDVPEARDIPLENTFHDANLDAGILDRNPVYAAKLRALEAVFAVPRPAERQQQFDAFRVQEGEGLERFALWCALAESLPPGAPEWSDPEFIESQRSALKDRIEFHQWLQWLCDEQLEAAQRRALDAGMNLGIVHDLAVGVHPAGADAWALQDVLAAGISVGAPPDMFNQQGQNWSQPPWHPERLAESGYAAYRDMLRTILRHAGGIRVDHILGLFRLWWIPVGGPPGEGAYVYYDHEALIGILALEAERAGVVVIGEDLGVFEPGVQDYLAERGILGTSILWFEYDGATPRPPESYRRSCLTSVTTHDLPPTAGYLAGEHVNLRESLGLLNRPVEEERTLDRAAQESVLSLVRSRVPVASQHDDDGGAATSGEQRTIDALHAFIAQTPSVLLGVALTDVVGERRTQNQPGTADEYPNWRIPLAGPDGEAILLDDLAANERFDSLVRALRER